MVTEIIAVSVGAVLGAGLVVIGIELGRRLAGGRSFTSARPAPLDTEPNEDDASRSWSIGRVYDDGTER